MHCMIKLGYERSFFIADNFLFFRPIILILTFYKMALHTAKVIGFILNICLVASQGPWARGLPTAGTSEPSFSIDSPTPLNFDKGPEQDQKEVKGVNPPQEKPKSVKITRTMDGMDLMDGMDSFRPYKTGYNPSSLNLPSAMSYLVI